MMAALTVRGCPLGQYDAFVGLTCFFDQQVTELGWEKNCSVSAVARALMSAMFNALATGAV